MITTKPLRYSTSDATYTDAGNLLVKADAFLTYSWKKGDKFVVTAGGVGGATPATYDIVQRVTKDTIVVDLGADADGDTEVDGYVLAARNPFAPGSDYLAYALLLNDKKTGTYAHGDALNVIGKDTGYRAAAAGTTVNAAKTGTCAAVATEGGGITLATGTTPAVDWVAMPTAGALKTYPRGTIIGRYKVTSLGLANVLFATGSPTVSGTDGAMLLGVTPEGALRAIVLIGGVQTTIFATPGTVVAGDIITAAVSWGESGILVAGVLPNGTLIWGYNTSTQALVVLSGARPKWGGNGAVNPIVAGCDLLAGAWWDTQLFTTQNLDELECYLTELECYLTDAYLHQRQEPPDDWIDANSRVCAVAGRMTAATVDFQWKGAPAVIPGTTAGRVRISYGRANQFLHASTTNGTAHVMTAEDSDAAIVFQATGLTAASRYWWIAEWSGDGGTTWYPFPGRRMKVRTRRSETGATYRFLVNSDSHFGKFSGVGTDYAGEAGLDIDEGAFVGEFTLRGYYAARDMFQKYGGSAQDADFVLDLGDALMTYRADTYFPNLEVAAESTTVTDGDENGIFGNYLGRYLHFVGGVNFKRESFKIIAAAPDGNSCTVDRCPVTATGADGTAAIYREIPWQRNAHMMLACGGLFQVMGNHEEEIGFMQAIDEGQERDAGVYLPQERACTRYRKALLPNPTNETYAEGGENEAVPEIPTSGAIAYASAVDWLPDISVAGGYAKVGDHVTSATDARDYFDKYVLRGGIGSPHLKIATSGGVTTVTDEHSLGLFTSDMVGSYLELDEVNDGDDHPVVIVNADRYVIASCVDANTVTIGGYLDPDYDGVAGRCLYFGLNRSPFGNYWAFTWGDVLIVALDPYRYTVPGGALHDDNRVVNDWSFGTAQFQRLETVLGNSTAKWKLVCFHGWAGGINCGIDGTAPGFYGRGSGAHIVSELGNADGALVRLCRIHHATIIKGHDHGFAENLQRGVRIVHAPSTGATMKLNGVMQAGNLGPPAINYPIDFGDARLHGTDITGMVASYPQWGYMVFVVNPGADTLTLTFRQTAVDLKTMGTPSAGLLATVGEYVGEVLTSEVDGTVVLGEAPRHVMLVCLDADGDFEESATPAVATDAPSAYGGKNKYPGTPFSSGDGIAVSLYDEPYVTAAIAGGAGNEVDVRVHCVPRDLYVTTIPQVEAPFRPGRRNERHGDEEIPMNLQLLAALTATGSDQPVIVPRDYALAIYPVSNDATLRDASGGANAITIPADMLTVLGRSLGQTVYLRATAGTVIQLALN